MKHFFIRIIFIIADILGINRLFRSVNSDKIRILMYHGVSHKRLPVFYWTLLDKNEFIRQMDYIGRKYNVVSPACLTDDDNSTANRVVITFDDGLLNNYTEVYPILKEHEYSAAFFVLPMLSESNQLMWTDRLFATLMAVDESELNLEKFELGIIRLDSNRAVRAENIKELTGQLKQMEHAGRVDALNHLFSVYDDRHDGDYDVFKLMSREKLVEISRDEHIFIGAHTDSHPILSTMAPDEQENEIAAGMEKLRQWGIEEWPVFAYPNGREVDFDSDTIEILKKLGFKAALTTIDGLHDTSGDRFRVRRINVGADTDKWEFRARLSGLFYFLQGK